MITILITAAAAAIVVGPNIVVFCQEREQQKGCESGHMLFGGKCEPIRGHGEPCTGKINLELGSIHYKSCHESIFAAR